MSAGRWWPSSHNAANHKIIIIHTPRPPPPLPPLPSSSSTAATRRPSRRSPMLTDDPGVIRCTSPPPSSAARRHLRHSLHVVNRQLPHWPTRKTRRRLPPSSAAAAMPDLGGSRGLVMSLMNIRLPSRDCGGRGRSPPSIDPHRGGGEASPRPAIALCGHRGLDPHHVRHRRPRQLRRRCPTTGGISLEVSPHHPHVLTCRVQL